MKLINRFNIGPRLGLGFGIVLVLAVLVGALALYQLGKVNNATKDMATNWLVSMDALDDYRTELAVLRNAEGAHLSAATPADMKTQEAVVKAAQGTMASAWQRYAPLVDDGPERELATAVQIAQRAYLEAAGRMLNESSKGEDNAEAARRAYMGDSGKAYATLVSALDKAVQFQVQGGQDAFATSQAAFSLAQLEVTGILAAALGLGAFLAFIMTRSITVPLETAVHVAQTVAKGDLTSVIEVQSKDETGVLLSALRDMNEKLAGIVHQVRNSSDSITTGSTEIASGNSDLSSRTEAQASSLEQTAASKEQLTATIRQNSDTAQQAAQLAQTASSAAEEGGRVVSNVIATMQDISQSSSKVADIIGVIDGIAFQTNILALNAAVEAARAGEQGRGFAVVASEVRVLAQRSAGAAKEIKDLITQSGERVQGGAKLVADAGASMQDIVGHVRRVNDLIAEISAASREQSSGIGQIGEAVSQLDQVTQQNAALVEEMAAAADSLKSQAAQMSDVVAVFRVAGAQLDQATHQSLVPPTSTRATQPRRPEPRPIHHRPTRSPVKHVKDGKAKPKQPSVEADWEAF
ncbi:methyl-accepting chemotaxis protein [Pseudorhodoferax aquiterrae]|uniref:Methyl-accepting chemotaxis protein n=1 Tax=Pseudorhodoferax aquiterrae TaxID=747304 RepID=A0ABQ3G988_9BURK|nr:methyl-accepting chemotaxis protein [Pseudorhodoferax aquiterrae]GHC98443.1 methyl-accepting chemotaxis protein [Pseudorhodoferax aquiterrae]